MKKNNGILLGVNPDSDLQYLLTICKKKLKKYDKNLITDAYNMCLEAHQGKVRKSGGPYYVHPLNVAIIVVTEIPLDDISVASALLHDILNYSDKFTLKDIEKKFGPTIAEIVDGIHKIKNIEIHAIEQLNRLENYRKLLLSLFTDVRIILIKLADRLHNMRTIEHLQKSRQNHIANETLEVYSPFANRFGLRNLKWELEDLAFKIINRPVYDSIRAALMGKRGDREEYVDNFIEPLKQKIANDPLIKKFKIEFEINGRAKHIYSIFNKMKLRQKSIDELYDLFAIRIILDTDDEKMCFYVYGIVCSIYPPVQFTFKDYISAPKRNGYKSIHTAVLGLDNKAVEVQIRTLKMHEISEQGFAAHFNYKPGLVPADSEFFDQDIQNWMSEVRNIFEKLGDESPQELLESVKRNLFADEIYVFTPKNEMKKLPVDSTTLDFAFNIHTEVGYRYIGAKVNGKIVPLDYKLQNGDQVEVLLSKKKSPSKEWLSLVVTSKAKYLIKRYFRDEEKKLVEEGMRKWQSRLKDENFEISPEEMEYVIQNLDIKEIGVLYSKFQSDNSFLNQAINLVKFKRHGKIPKKINGSKKKINVRNNLYSKIIIASCCKPLPGDEIKGLLKDTTLKIHRSICSQLSQDIISDEYHLVDVNWQDIPKRTYNSKLMIKADDMEGIITKLNNAILDTDDILMEGVDFDSENKIVTAVYDLSVKSLAQLNDLISNILSVNGVKSVNRLMSK